MPNNYQELRNSVNRSNYDKSYPSDRPKLSVCHSGDATYIGDDTKNRKTWNGIPWIDYWRAFTDESPNVLTCAICGKPIYVHWDELDEEGQLFYSEDKDKAEGGHIAGDKIHKRFWIVPMCPACNGKEGNTEVTFDHDVIAVEEKHPNIV